MAHDTICHAPLSTTIHAHNIFTSIYEHSMRNVSALIRSQFIGWQAPLIAWQLPAGQLAPPQPQDDFPFFLPRTILTIIAATTRTKTTLMMIVAIFSTNHVNIEIPPTIAVKFLYFSRYEFAVFTFLVSFVASL